MIKYNVIGLDREWPVTLNMRGMPTSSGKVSLIQNSYMDSNDKIQVILIRTGHLKKLPNRLEASICDNSLQISGVRVSVDLIRTGIDFDIKEVKAVVQKDRPNVINIGTYTRVCHVVQNGSLSLAELCKMVLKVNLDKNADIRLSDWNAPKLTPSQMKYATLDAIFSLTIFLELDKIPDLTRRYTMKDVKNKEGTIVDSVPIHG